MWIISETKVQDVIDNNNRIETVYMLLVTTNGESLEIKGIYVEYFMVLNEENGNIWETF